METEINEDRKLTVKMLREALVRIWGIKSQQVKLMDRMIAEIVRLRGKNGNSKPE